MRIERIGMRIGRIVTAPLKVIYIQYMYYIYIYIYIHIYKYIYM
jgi:hypothetical protein